MPLSLNDIAQNNSIGKFDVIILGEVIEHIDPIFCSQILKHLYNNFLNTSGIVIITTPNVHSFWYRLRLLFGIDIEVAPIEDDVMGYGHIHIWSNYNLVKILKHIGYKNINTTFQNGMYFWNYRKFPKNPFKKYFYFRYIMKLF